MNDLDSEGREKDFYLRAASWQDQKGTAEGPRFMMAFLISFSPELGFDSLFIIFSFLGFIVLFIFTTRHQQAVRMQITFRRLVHPVAFRSSTPDPYRRCFLSWPGPGCSQRRLISIAAPSCRTCPDD